MAASWRSRKSHKRDAGLLNVRYPGCVAVAGNYLAVAISFNRPWTAPDRPALGAHIALNGIQRCAHRGTLLSSRGHTIDISQPAFGSRAAPLRWPSAA